MSEIFTFLFYIVAFLVILAFFWYLRNVGQFTVFEHERGLFYRNGKFQRALSAGKYGYVRSIHTIQKVDIRARFVSIVGQEVLTSDNVTIKVSLAANFKIGDPYKAVHATANYQETLYLLLQLHLRDLIGTMPVDDLLAKRKEIAGLLLETTQPNAEEIGLELISVGIKDIMFPGELKNIFAQVVNAQKEGLAALERARGESAALRNLANTAKLLENNPALLQLRLIQALNTTSGNTVVLKFPQGDVDLTGKKSEGGSSFS